MVDNRETLGHFLDSGDLWGEIQTVKDYPFFTDFTPQRLNDFTDLAFGNRTLYSKFNTETGLDAESAAQFIVMQYDKKWLGLIAVNAIDFDLAALETERKTETSNETETTGRETETLNKVSAFNSEDLVTDGGTTSTETGDHDKEGQRITTSGKQSLSAAWGNLTMTEKTGIVRTITGDVACFLSLETY